MPNSDQKQPASNLRGNKETQVGMDWARSSKAIRRHNKECHKLETPHGSRRVGRLSHTWKRQIITELSKLHLQWNEVKYRADDRTHWKQLLRPYAP